MVAKLVLAFYREIILLVNALKQEMKSTNTLNSTLCKCEHLRTLQTKNIDKAFIHVPCKSHMDFD